MTAFSPHHLSQLLTCSDDRTAALHDLTSSTPLLTLTGHTDYVRSGCFLPSSPHLLLTGSYDATLRLWDTRTGASEMTLALPEDAPSSVKYAVEAVLPYPSGGMVLSAAGPVVRVWDVVAGGRCVKAFSNHQKTVTCLTWDGVGKRRLLSGGMDQMVKVYDVADWKVVHTMRYTAPVLSLAISVRLSPLSCHPVQPS